MGVMQVRAVPGCHFYGVMAAPDLLLLTGRRLSLRSFCALTLKLVHASVEPIAPVSAETDVPHAAAPDGPRLCEEDDNGYQRQF